MTTSDPLPARSGFRPILRAILSVLNLALILLPALIAVFLIARAFVDGNVSDIEYGIGLVLIFAVVTLITRVPGFANKQARWRFLRRLAVVILPIAFLFPMSVVVLIFGEIDMAAYVFHLVFAMDGTPLGHILPYILTALIYWLVILATLYRLQHVLAYVPLWWAAVALLILAANPMVYDLAYNRLQAEYGNTPSLMEHYAEPNLIPADQGPRPDIILIYLEGLEQTYGEAVFDGLIDPLKELQKEALVFDNVRQAFGTGWSLGGTVASMCGVALLPQGARPKSRMADIQWIVPKVRCLTDVLAERGYRSTYVSTVQIAGNKMGFYGFDNFFTTHQLTEIIDRENAQTPRAIEGRRTGAEGWGLRDADLYDIGLQQLEQRLQSDQPYALILASMDTHGPQAFMSPACVAAGQPAVSDDLADAVRCTARLTLDFVRQAQQMTAGRDTRIILTSDHLAHHNNLTNRLKDFERRNLVMMLGAGDAPRRINTPAIMSDLYPTMLDWLGLGQGDPVRAGIGVSLLSDAPTLTRSLGSATVDRRLKVDVKLGRHIWRQE